MDETGCPIQYILIQTGCLRDYNQRLGHDVHIFLGTLILRADVERMC